MYIVRLATDGTVTTVGLQYTPSRGPYQVSLPSATVAQLKSAFLAANFCQLQDRYTSKGNSFISDIPGTYLSFLCGDHLKTVYDYCGTPAVVRDLELKVQQAAQLERFLFSDRSALEARFAHGLLPASREAEKLLIEAIRWKDNGLVNYLLSKGVDPNTPLLKTSYDGRSSALMTAVISNQVEMSYLLFDHGANVRSTNSSGETPLISALRETGTASIVSALVRLGIDVNQPDGGGNTPLMYAALRLRPDLVQLLLDAGADKSSKNNSGTTALTYARQRPGCHEYRPGAGLNTLANEDDPDYTLCDQSKTISLLSRAPK